MDFCRQCASEENRERATKSIESIAHSKKRMDVFPRPPTDDETTRRRRSWEINARSATSVVSSRSTRRADDRPSIDRSIVGPGSRSPVLHHHSRRSVPTKRTRGARTHHVFRGTERPIRANDNVALRLRRRAKQVFSQSLRPSVHPFIHPSRSSSSYLSSRIHHPSTFGNRIERAIGLRARTARAPRDLLRPETAA